MLPHCARQVTQCRPLVNVGRHVEYSRTSTLFLARRYLKVQKKLAPTPQAKPKKQRRFNDTTFTVFTKQADDSFQLEKFDPELPLGSEEMQLLGGAPLPKIGLGDWVEAHRLAGIVVSQRPIRGGLQMIGFISQAGGTVEIASDNIPFSIPNFLQFNDIREILQSAYDYDRDGSQLIEPPEADFRRVTKLFEDRIRYLEASHLARFGQLHDHFSNQQAEKGIATVLLDDMAKFTFQVDHPTIAQMYATHMYATKNNIQFTATSNVRGSRNFILRPNKDVEVLEWIMDEIRFQRPSYTSFLERAREYVSYSTRERDDTSGIVHPSEEYNRLPQFTKDDKKYIDFIAEWVMAQKFALNTPHEVFAPTILKALKCYNDIFIELDVAARFLRDIGMWQPWDNMTLLQQFSTSAEHCWSRKAQENEEIMKTAEGAFKAHSKSILIKSNQHLAPHEFYPNDICDGIRHDFGQLPVYTIDDPSAKEIDDGVSIEDHSDHTWIHVHVADPSAYIHPGHQLANVMAARVQTLYLPERHFPLLPESLSSQKFSLLSPEKNSSLGAYTMSFSAKVDSSGNIVDVKVRPGLVHNICKLSYDQVDAILNDTNVNPSVSSKSKSELSVLARVAQTHLKNRIADGYTSFQRSESSIQLDPYPLTLPRTHYDQPNFVQSIPNITITKRDQAQSVARSMVAECMIMAGRVTSAMSTEHGIPMVYRMQEPPNVELFSTSEQELVKSILSSRNPIDGSIPLSEAFQLLPFISPGSATTQPGRPHWMMGLTNGYTKVTSPLRRYLDIVAHWQLKAALLNEPIPFSEQVLTTMGARYDMREKQLSRQSAMATDWWIAETLRREKANGKLVNRVWDCIINSESENVNGHIFPASGFLPSLGLTGKIEGTDNQNFHVGESYHAIVKDIDSMSPRFTIEIVH
ncbi:hypothetical protein NQZ79_g1961 [Umbelopsis isabellina]|nr:hypothetical protein NQZ79_g1961 [Umbelopsis isabellina]